LKSIVLLSGGLDSTVSLAFAMKDTVVSLCLTFDYGQKAAENENFAAAALAEYYRVQHKIIKLPFLKEFTNSSLITRDKQIPAPGVNRLDNYRSATAAAKSVWVPNRNGMFINIASSLAESLQCAFVITGFNREEAITFPDNSAEFVSATNDALSYSTLNKVKVVSYTQRLSKAEIIKLGMKLRVPFHLIWSCYQGGTKMCGSCESCLLFLQAAKKAGLEV
jgi:7-cyano-7-deazaguanine synthase